MPFTLRNIEEDLEDIGPRLDGAPDLEFRAATKALDLETAPRRPSRDLGRSARLRRGHALSRASLADADT